MKALGGECFAGGSEHQALALWARKAFAGGGRAG
jgi:hypothetical protein